MSSDRRRQSIEEQISVLDSSASPVDLETAATELAVSDDPDAVDALVVFLRRSDFLDRLDEPDSADKLLHLRAVLSALGGRPSPEVARACLQLVDEPVYLEHDRKAHVLEALAAVVPMTAPTADAFRRANDEGYFAYDALLLASNGSPVALELFRSMMGDQTVDAEARVELLHKGILPNRTRLAILQLVASLIGDNLEAAMTIAAIESVFDYQLEWFTLHGPTPPAWRTASNDVLRYVLDLGTRVQVMPDLPPSLPPAIDNTTEIARLLLAARGA